MTFSLGPRAASAGYRIAAFDSIGSTNAEALMRARAGETGPIWLATTEQTAGRGRRQRAWVSPRGNLASSILEVIDTSPAVAATLSFAAGLALEAALQTVSLEARMRSPGSENATFHLKWPNDVLAGGKKLAGILLEAETVAHDRLAVVVGIGTNVVAAPEGIPYPAVSLRDLGIDIGAADLFRALTEAWVEFRQIWDGGRGFGDIRRLWLDRAAGVGQAVSVRSGASTISGLFDTIDEDGCLIVATSDGKRMAVSAGDVYFGAAASIGAT
ncbi:Biotin--acetyl-CoA-carboxylase ligase [Nitrobacter hamburgensis X14]|uniref:biotin--[biotin carboxyl-carrier protein] ligase n=1 Tax=Nitrobacter hamburgensis (strain DSM 10229 / NCIMB 13809 / X14) TaxID=323097 RepID=Q1QL99_NITHX|nr:biotin--[acetyl-CoA-carboxylase] ligase [Nitrobacter hamburgensis]ABE62998.1 Biotin--acetyl-CoA-carboxylase ligase [Nitrobacter hamburgensis X14]